VTLAIFLQPAWLAILYIWCFVVLSAVQLTVRLIMAFSVRSTAMAALVMAVLALPVAFVYDLVIGPAPSLTTRFEAMPVPILLMAAAGFGIARWVLRFRRMRGQVVAGVMVGLLNPHLFTLIV
jgi:hypothetical protein